MSVREVESQHVQGVGWLQGLLEPRKVKNTVSALLQAIELSEVRFSHVAFTGLSGALVGPIIAYELGKYPLAVRRRGETSQGGVHSSHDVEGGRVTVERRENYPRRVYRGAFRYIVVDDLISTGTSMRHIFNTVWELHREATPVGIFLYENGHRDISWAPGFLDPFDHGTSGIRRTIPVYDGAVRFRREMGDI